MSTLKTNNIQHVDRSDPSIIISTDGGVSIAGTLTYEDVTSVDAVGIVTGRELINAQKQIHVGTGVSVKAGGLNVTAGITTVQALQAQAISGTTGTFTGDVDIADKIVHTGDTDTAIRFSGADTISFETAGVQRLKLDGSSTVFNDGGSDVDFRIEGDTDANLFKLDAGNNRIGIGEGSPNHKLTVGGDIGVGFNTPNDAARQINFNVNRGSAGQTLANINWQWNSKYVAQIRGMAGADTTNKDDAHLTFYTSAANSLVERLRITSTGTVGIATDSPAGKLDVHGSGSTAIIRARRIDGNGGYNLFEGYSDVNAASTFYVSNNGSGYFKQNSLIGTTTAGLTDYGDKLTIAGANAGMTLRVSATNQPSHIYFADGTSSTAQYMGYIQYHHNSDEMKFGTSSVERMVLGSGGQLTVDVGAPGSSNKVIGRFQAQSSRALDIVWHDSGSLMGFDTPGDHSYIFKCNGTERMRLTAAGRLGINADANGPDRLLHVNETSNAAATTPFRLTNAAGSPGTEVRMEFECGLDEIAYISAKNEGSDIGPLMFATATSQAAYPTEKMRLTPSGQLLINRTSPNDDEMFSVFTDSTSHEMINLRNNASSGTKDMITMIHVANSGDRVFMRFKRTGSVSNVGTIVTTASATAYNTSSDYRLKENAVAISDGITRLKTLKPYRFNFKVEPDKTVDGFFAHEVSPIIPEAVHGTKDAVETTYYTDGDTLPEGKVVGDVKEENAINPQSLDYAKFTPLLTAALQEAVTRIETLEAQIAALIGG